MITVDGYRPTLRSLGKTFAVTNIYAAAIAVVNRLTGGNYLFLSRKPESASIIDFLGPWPWYILSLEAVLIAACLLFYLPFTVKRYASSHKS
jgi:hypothetical integral membrane protein (TIGR02206 family)